MARSFLRPFQALTGAGLLAMAVALPAGAETLAEATAWAVAHHPALAADQDTVAGSDQSVAAARSELFPVLSVSGEVNTDNYMRDAGPMALQGREVGVEANQLVFDGSAAWAKVEALGRERAALAADRDRNGNTIAYGVARTYLAVLRNRELVRSAQHNLDEHRRSVSRLVAIVKQDRGKAFDLVQVQAREAFAESLVAERQAALRAEEAVYQELVGQAPGQLAMPQPLAGEGFRSLDDALEVAQRAHPAVVAAQSRRQGAKAAFDQAEARLVPKFYLNARYYTGVDRQAVPGWNSEAYVGVKTSFLFGGASVAAGRAAREDVAAAAARVEAEKRDAREGVRVAWEQRAGMIADLLPVEDALRQSATVLDGFKTQYTFGRRTVLDLLIVQNEAFQAESRAIQLRYDRLLADFAVAAQEGRLESLLLAHP
jgi:adhesin transport system outer membrane protein